jgi:sulfur-oxidizing protein SoxB
MLLFFTPELSKKVIFLLGLIILSVVSFTAVGKNKKLRLIGTNDIHNYVRPIYYRYINEIKPWGETSREGDYAKKAALIGKIGGMAYVATLIRQLKNEVKQNALIVDAGDTWHGSGLSLFDHGNTMLKIMNQIGYDAMALGNWEFFLTHDHLLKLVDQAKFKVLAFNVLDKEWEEPVFEQFMIKNIGGVKVALVGMTYPWTALTSSITGAARDWKFGIRENRAKELIKKIRTTHQPDILIWISHGGYGLDQKFARRVSDIDVLFSGHTHDEVFDPVVWNKTIVFQAGAHGKYVAALDLEIKNKKVVNYKYQLIPVLQKRLKADPVVLKIIDQGYAPFEKRLSRVIGETDTILYRRDFWQSPIGNLLTDIMRENHKTDIAFFPAWRYGATILPGAITVEDVYNIIPTKGHVFTYKMHGKEIKMLLENILDGVAGTDPYARVGGDMIRFSGLELIYDLGEKSQHNIISLKVNGTKMKMDQIYTIASTHTRFHKNPLFGASEIKDTGQIFVEELMAYIQKNRHIISKLDQRIRAKGSR